MKALLLALVVALLGCAATEEDQESCVLYCQSFARCGKEGCAKACEKATVDNAECVGCRASYTVCESTKKEPQTLCGGVCE